MTSMTCRVGSSPDCSPYTPPGRQWRRIRKVSLSMPAAQPDAGFGFGVGAQGPMPPMRSTE
jgi:hypothetical protein